MKLVIGLGNPGLKYKNTRHNIGFLIIDNFKKRVLKKSTVSQISTDEKIQISTDIDDKNLCSSVKNLCPSVKIFKPQCFMNNSGVAVKKAIDKCGIDLKDTLVVCDDINLELGIIRFRARGSAGGHRGLQSIIDALGTQNFNRFRIGIGADKGVILRDYVLSKFRPPEKKVLGEVIDRATEAIGVWIEEGIEVAMSRYNEKNPNIKNQISK